jgi:hypothetical protein
MPQMGVVIDDMRNWKLQRNYLWELRLPEDIGGGLEVSKYCQDIAFGDYNMEEVSTIRYGAFKAHFAGFLSVGTITATFLKPIPDIVTTYFYSWRSKIVDEQGFYYPKNSYARTIRVTMMGQDGSETCNFRFEKAFPTKFPAYELSYREGTLTMLKVEFSVDRVFIE